MNGMKGARSVENMQSSVGETFCTLKTSTDPESSPRYQIQIDQMHMRAPCGHD